MANFAIDRRRPKIPNADGSFSTERTIGIEADGRHYNIPTIVNGRQVSQDEAAALWRAGQNPEVGVFQTQAQADTAAPLRSEEIGRVRDSVTLNIEGRRVKVGREFLHMSPEDQNAAVDEIGASIGALAPKQPPGSKAFRDEMTAALDNPKIVKGEPLQYQNKDRALTSGYNFVEAMQHKVPFGDEVDAATGATLNSIGRAFTGKPGSWSEDYDKRKADIAASQDMYAMEHPWASAGARGLAIGASMGSGAAAQQAPGFVGGAIQGMKQAGGTGALYGFSEGETLDERTTNAAIGGGVGLLTGGVLGGAAGAGAGRTSSPASTPIVQAADRQGITVPRAVTSDSMLVQRAGQTVAKVPGAGNIMQQAADDTVRQLDDTVRTVADDISISGAPDVATAGNRLREGLDNWIGKTSKAKVERAYKEVDLLIDPAAKAGLSETAKTAATIGARRQAAAMPDSAAVRYVGNATSRPEGLTYQGLKTLRTSVGEMLENPSRLPADIAESELKLIYGSLTRDLQNTVQAAGNPGALQRFQRANQLASATAGRREALNRLLGGESRSDEALTASIQRLAGSTASADVSLLMKARRSMPGDEWDDVVASVLARLGRDNEGVFSPRRFVTDYGKLSKAGRSILIRDRGAAQALDDIATISSRFKELERFGNPSGTGQTVIGAGVGTGFLTAPLETIGTLAGANGLARILAKPETAKGMSAWSKAYANYVARPSRYALQALSTANRSFVNEVRESLGIELELPIPKGPSPTGYSR